MSGTGGGASLQQEGVAHVAHPHRSRVRGQGQLVTRTTVAVDVSTVSTVMLQHKHGQLIDIALKMQFKEIKIQRN